MNMRHLLLSAALLLTGSSAPPPAIWMRSASVEWWANLADEILLVEVAGAKELEPLNEYHISRELTCRTKEALRGAGTQEQTFRHDFHRTGKVDRAIEIGDELLLFVIQKLKFNDTNPVFWVSLTRPHPKLATHAAHDNTARLLTSKDEILKTVRSRLTGADAKTAPRKRGVIMEMPEADIYWDFVRTADPDLKPGLLKDLGSKYSQGRCNAIHNLISYPDAETIKAIRALLTDPDTQEVRAYGEKQETIRYYPVRQAAYLALTLLGEKVEKPAPYFNTQSLLFTVGLDVETYFPYGDWKRLEK